MRNKKGQFVKGSNGWTGHKHSEKTKQKLREQHIGKKLSPETVEKIRVANKKPNSGQFKKGMKPKNMGTGLPKERDMVCAVCGTSYHWIAKKRITKLGYTQYLNLGKPAITCSPKCSYELKARKMRGIERPYMQGENSYLWRGGITPLYHQIRWCTKYRQWRENIFKRDNWTCKICFKRGNGILHADHYPITFSRIINTYKIVSLKETKKCSMLWETINGRTLCKECHRETETYGQSLERQEKI